MSACRSRRPLLGLSYFLKLRFFDAIQAFDLESIAANNRGTPAQIKASAPRQLLPALLYLLHPCSRAHAPCLLDFDAMIIHAMIARAREFYQLEKLWSVDRTKESEQ
jgi:hypothetical protein